MIRSCALLRFLRLVPLLALTACGASAGTVDAGPGAVALDSTFANPRPVSIRGYAGDAMEPFVTRDGRFLLFNNSNDPSVDTQLHVARATISVSTTHPVDL